MHLPLFTTFCPNILVCPVPTQYFWQVYASAKISNSLYVHSHWLWMRKCDTETFPSNYVVLESSMLILRRLLSLFLPVPLWVLLLYFLKITCLLLESLNLRPCEASLAVWKTVRYAWFPNALTHVWINVQEVLKKIYFPIRVNAEHTPLKYWHTKIMLFICNSTCMI